MTWTKHRSFRPPTSFNPFRRFYYYSKNFGNISAHVSSPPNDGSVWEIIWFKDNKRKVDSRSFSNLSDAMNRVETCWKSITFPEFSIKYFKRLRDRNWRSKRKSNNHTFLFPKCNSSERFIINRILAPEKSGVLEVCTSCGQEFFESDKFF